MHGVVTAFALVKPPFWKSVSSTYVNWQVVSEPSGLIDVSSSALLGPTLLSADSASIEAGGAVKSSGVEAVDLVRGPSIDHRAEVVERARRQAGDLRERGHVGRPRAEIRWAARDGHEVRAGEAHRLEVGVVDVLELAGRVGPVGLIWAVN